MKQILFTDLGIAIYLLTGVVLGIALGAPGRRQARELRRQRDRLFQANRHLRDQLVGLPADLAVGSDDPVAVPSPTGRRLYALDGGRG